VADVVEDVHDSGAPIVVVQNGGAIASVRTAREARSPGSAAHFDRRGLVEAERSTKIPRGGMAGSVIFNISDEELVYFETSAEWGAIR
jgi:hypothetical protein